jgi:hypothetical protein
VDKLRTRRVECHLLSSCTTVAGIANLLTLNTRNESTLTIDLNVYFTNQQFRLFDCVKRGKNKSLLQSTYFPFKGGSEISYFDLLRTLIVTITNDIDVSIVYL